MREHTISYHQPPIRKRREVAETCKEDAGALLDRQIVYLAKRENREMAIRMWKAF